MMLFKPPIPSPDTTTLQDMKINMYKTLKSIADVIKLDKYTFNFYQFSNLLMILSRKIDENSFEEARDIVKNVLARIPVQHTHNNLTYNLYLLFNFLLEQLNIAIQLDMKMRSQYSLSPLRKGGITKTRITRTAIRKPRKPKITKPKVSSKKVKPKKVSPRQYWKKLIEKLKKRKKKTSDYDLYSYRHYGSPVDLYEVKWRAREAKRKIQSAEQEGLSGLLPETY